MRFRRPQLQLQSSRDSLVVVLGSVEVGEDGVLRLSERDETGDAHWGRNRLVHRALRGLRRSPQIQPACLMRAVNSCTRLYTERSSRIRRAILEVAWMTVGSSRPPKCRPIFGSDESVSSRERYIATWRG